MYKLLFVLLLTVCQLAQAQTNVSNQSLPVPALMFDSTGTLVVTASATSSKTDFDFFIGTWQLDNRLLKKNADGTTTWQEFKATQQMYTILRGIGNIDNFIATRDGKPFEGMTLRLFNPQTKLWSIYWADSRYGILYLPPVTGSFENHVGHFFSQDTVNGKKVITVYRWDARDVTHPVWSQATSADNGQTWEWNWYMYFTKKGKG